METKQKNHLIRFAKNAFTAIFWSQIVVGVVLIIIASITARERGAFAIPIPVTYSPITIEQLTPIAKNFPMATLNSENGILSIHAEASLANMILMLIGYGIIFFTILFVVYQLKKLCKNFSNAEAFKLENAKRIRKISLILIAGNIAQIVFTYCKNSFLRSKLNLKSLELTNQFDFDLLIFGIVLFVIAWIINIGYKLEEEQKFTV